MLKDTLSFKCRFILMALDLVCKIWYEKLVKLDYMYKTKLAPANVMYIKYKLLIIVNFGLHVFLHWTDYNSLLLTSNYRLILLPLPTIKKIVFTWTNGLNKDINYTIHTQKSITFVTVKYSIWSSKSLKLFTQTCDQ